jgi:hypothetical protein
VAIPDPLGARTSLPTSSPSADGSSEELIGHDVVFAFSISLSARVEWQCNQLGACS